ncbi:MAG: YcjX family protein [Hyphomicrobiaceae bacterium]|nr:YcjX family protein [Hyphomicrobiaceae bacterium]
MTDTAADSVRAASTYVQDLATPTLRLGVTGLSRAGKTVFITALVRTLTTATAQPPIGARLRPGFRAYLEPQPDDDIPRFAYEEHLAVLAGEPPGWPESTRQISQLRVALEWEPSDWTRRTLGIGRRLHVDIVDYPGEWLIDLGLMSQTYEHWSANALARLASAPRSATTSAWDAFSRQLAPGIADVEATAIKGAALYTAWLSEARDNRKQVLTVAPGRFLMPGDLAGSPLLTFFPMSKSGDHPGALHAFLKGRFESYKKKVVVPFFENHFSRLDRQIVLVDALGALNAGGDAMHELDDALESVLAAFRPGAQSWLYALLGRRIDRILFAATKADHLNRHNHDRLRAILGAVVQRASERAEMAGAEIDVTALAALRATEDVDRTSGNDTLPCIRGIPRPGETIAGRHFDGSKSAVIFPGDLPSDPHEAFATETLPAGRLNFARFQPPRIATAADGSEGYWPHIGLDHAIRFLIGDRLT